MADETPVSPRLSDVLASVPVAAAETYPAKAEGPKRVAALRDDAGTVLGYVWTDDRRAAGWRHAGLPDAAGARAGAYVWRVHRAAFAQGVPASDLLNPALYAPLYHLDA
ncbi:hypothetical protein ACFY19_20750 [Streptosporangium saharense]|uniref:hypothetical protein n=1 Tax=Streptosporangium saharense TaxID=1706840 RepID=UPI0036C23BF2